MRDYQVEMLGRLHEAWRRHRSVMLQMPTGTGKTVLLAAAIARELPSTEAGVLIVAHRRELLEQIRDTLARFGIGTGTAGGSVRVESIQALARRADGLPGFEPSLVIVDEAHHAPAATYRVLWDWWPRARFLGLTATPCRLNGAPFTDLFDVLLQSEPIQAFIDRGWLSDFEYVSASPDSRAVRQVRSLRKRGADGDYQLKEMALVMDVPESIAHLYESYRQFADGKRGIVYAIDRSHARHIADCYQSRGVSCCAIDSRTPAAERERMVEDYRRGRVQVLVNVDIFGEGFDVPEVEFIQLARPTLSLSKYMQQVGRGMRVSEGKPHVLILDMVGLYQLFGLPTAERDWRMMFLGRAQGKGDAGLTRRPLILSDSADQKELHMLEMVRIRRCGEQPAGTQLFMQDGRYGVMRDGKVTCQPVFEKVTRLAEPYFALATYPYRDYRGRTTVIDGEGRDLRAELYGRVSQEGDFFLGADAHYRAVCWDAVGGRYYRGGQPDVEKIGRLEAVRQGSRYQLRQQTPRLDFAFQKDEVLMSGSLTIIRDMLIVKKDARTAYKIQGYLGDAIVVENPCGYGARYQEVLGNGKMGSTFNQMPVWATRRPRLEMLGLKRMA